MSCICFAGCFNRSIFEGSWKVDTRRQEVRFVLRTTARGNWLGLGISYNRLMVRMYFQSLFLLRLISTVRVLTVRTVISTVRVLLSLYVQWGPCALRHGIQNSMEAILACHPARSTKLLNWVAKWCERWRMRTGPIDGDQHQAMYTVGVCFSEFLGTSISPILRQKKKKKPIASFSFFHHSLRSVCAFH